MNLFIQTAKMTKIHNITVLRHRGFLRRKIGEIRLMWMRRWIPPFCRNSICKKGSSTSQLSRSKAPPLRDSMIQLPPSLLAQIVLRREPPQQRRSWRIADFRTRRRGSCRMVLILPSSETGTSSSQTPPMNQPKPI